MARAAKTTVELKCLSCGFEAPAGEAWTRVDHPPLGSLTQCRECGSTNIHSRE